MKGTKVSMHIPTDQEFDLLMDVTHEDDSLSHWKKMYSWVNDIENEHALSASDRAYRGYDSARYWGVDSTSYRDVHLGFRPAVDLEPGAQPSDIRDGESVVVGTLYMSGVPVRVPQHPTWDGDITDYIPGAKLEMRPALDDPSYQVTAIMVDVGVAVADRNLLKSISYVDLEGMTERPSTEAPARQPEVKTSLSCERLNHLLNAVIDKMIEDEGGHAYRVAETLLGLGFTRDELVYEFHFPESDVNGLI